jgi:site-specific recombinase XerD
VHVKEAMGHSDLRTTMGYTHLAREHLESLVAAPEVA